MKYHLDKHFADNNEIRKRKRVAPLMYPCYASAMSVGASIPFGQQSSEYVGLSMSGSSIGVSSENRPFFQSLKAWVN